MGNRSRIYLSPPYQTGEELRYLKEVLESNWLAPAGIYIDRFEQAIEEKFGYNHVIAVNSGTAALHLILNHLKVGAGDEVLVSNLTFIASVNPVLYQGAKPILIDSEKETWNIDPDLLEKCLREKSQRGKIPKALILVYLYGMPAKIDQIVKICDRYGVVIIEDVAEGLGSTYKGAQLGSFGEYAFLSFNGNKIATTAGGGAVITKTDASASHITKLASQSKENKPYYQHEELGFNYRMNSLSAGLGLAQLENFEDRLNRKRLVYDYYKKHLTNFSFLEEPDGFFSNRWLTNATHDNIDPVQLVIAMDKEFNVECKPIWKPMHKQPLLKECEVLLNGVSDKLYANGISLPSGAGISKDQQDFVIEKLIDLTNP